MTAQRRADFLLLSVTIVWGSTFVITKSLLDDTTPLIYSGIRFCTAALILFLIFPRRCVHISKNTFKHGIILGLVLYVGFVLQTVGIGYTTASKAAFFTGMLVPFTPIIHFIAQRVFHIKKRSLKIGNVIGILCAAFGLYLLTSPSGSSFNLGDALNLASAVMFATFIVYLDTVPQEIDKLQMTFVQFLVCGVAGMLVAVIFEHPHTEFTTGMISGFLYLVIFATVITMWIQNRFQGDTTPTRAAVIFAMEPVVAAIFAYFVRGEIIGMLGIIGGIIIMGGLLFSEFSDEIPMLSTSISTAEDNM